jgi:7-carboxy-7-deazaguanine synthase
VNELSVASIYTSIDGEHNGYGKQGELTTFIRLAGCSLGCKYCDTPQAQMFSNGTKIGPGELVDRVWRVNPKKLTITGGEPLEQFDGLMQFLNLWTHISPIRITIETNGVHSLLCCKKNSQVSYVVDYKPESICLLTGEQQEERRKNIDVLLGGNDLVKYILTNEEDYKNACEAVYKYINVPAVFSPIHNLLSPAQLVEWMVRDDIAGVPVNLQLHKYIWSDYDEQER